MKRTMHEKIIFGLKVTMFSVFAYRTIRVFVRTWKYGGNSTQSDIDFDDDDAIGIIGHSEDDE